MKPLKKKKNLVKKGKEKKESCNIKVLEMGTFTFFGFIDRFISGLKDWRYLVLIMEGEQKC